MQKHYYVYILTNQRNTVLYTGVTGNLPKRIFEHKNKVTKGFTAKYNVNKLIYYETFDDPEYAIMREKQIKAGSRRKKINLIKSINPKFQELLL